MLDIREELKYFREKPEEISPTPDLIVELSGLGPWLESLHAVQEQLIKQTRLAYKANQETNSKLDTLFQEVNHFSAIHNEHIQLQQKMNEWEWRIISIIDQLDHSSSFFQEQQNQEWDGFFQRIITQLLQDLQTLGIEEISVLNRSFDPFVCEALGTLERIEGEQYVPYQVQKVIRRGFRKNGDLMRKAQVVTIKERGTEDDK